MGPVAAGRKGRGARGSLGKAAKVGWKAGVSVFLRASSVVFPGRKEGEKRCNQRRTCDRAKTVHQVCVTVCVFTDASVFSLLLV